MAPPRELTDEQQMQMALELLQQIQQETDKLEEWTQSQKENQ